MYNSSRLSSAESSTIINGVSVPIFNEEYVNSGALLANKQEVVLNAFMTEIETVAKASSPLGRLIPFIGSSKKKQKSKNLLFVSLQAEEILPLAEQFEIAETDLPHVDIEQRKNIYSNYNAKLRSTGVTDTVDLAKVNKSKIEAINSVDPLTLEGDL